MHALCSYRLCLFSHPLYTHVDIPSVPVLPPLYTHCVHTICACFYLLYTQTFDIPSVPVFTSSIHKLLTYRLCLFYLMYSQTVGILPVRVLPPLYTNCGHTACTCFTSSIHKLCTSCLCMFLPPLYTNSVYPACVCSHGIFLTQTVRILSVSVSISSKHARHYFPFNNDGWVWHSWKSRGASLESHDNKNKSLLWA